MPSTNLKIAHKAPRLGASPSIDKATYYVFNSGQTDKGFVIVAGDDRAPAVLGYSDKGTFEADNLPPAMQEMLEGYAAQIEALDQGAIADEPITAHEPIAPLVQAVWTQSSPYNILLPYVEEDKHAYVGCVATAMAQVLHYWQYPPRTTKTIPSYTTSTLGIYMPALPVVTFDWDSMLNTYQSNDTTSVNSLAVATLSLYCAQAMEMNFKTSSSGATTALMPSKLAAYFGYNSATTLRRTSYTTQGWADIIYAELAASRPVIYSASKVSGGHAFVCDGYDGNGMFHINWGWNGQSNGYFLLNVLNPSLQGTGSASGAYGYVYSQSAIVGIEPGGTTVNEVMMTATNVTLNSYSTSRQSSSSNFTAKVSAHFLNYTSQVIAADFGWGLYQDSTFIKVLYNTYTSSLSPGYYINASERSISFGSGLSNGTYRIVPICSERNSGNWKPCNGADMNYIEVTINGNRCTYTGHSITTEGYMHPNRPININVNLTNNGETDNLLLHLHVNGEFTASSFVGLENGETGDIPYSYMPTEPGTYTLTFSFNDDGSNPIATRYLTINEMPEANLSATMQILNLTDSANSIITSDKFSVLLTVTNEGTTTYDEDISAKLYKSTYDNYGSNVQGKYQRLTLAPGETTTLRFDMDNVVDGWRYFFRTYYYSGGEEVLLYKVGFHTIVFPTEPEFEMGDINGDGTVNITDVTLLINYVLSESSTINIAYSDINGDGAINITDVTLLINIVLNAE